MGVVRQGLIQRLVARMNLRFPTLFVVFLVLTIADLLIPDVIPLADEIGLALITTMLALWKKRREPDAGSR